MSPADAYAVAEYLKNGGQVVKVQETIPATDQEVINYLATCGHRAKYCDGDMRQYLCDGKRWGVLALVRRANRYRRAQQLAPFALRVPIRVVPHAAHRM